MRLSRNQFLISGLSCCILDAYATLRGAQLWGSSYEVWPPTIELMALYGTEMFLYVLAVTSTALVLCIFLYWPKLGLFGRGFAYGLLICKGLLTFVHIAAIITWWYPIPNSWFTH